MTQLTSLYSVSCLSEFDPTPRDTEASLWVTGCGV